jgi:hypothetical protein
MEIQGIPNKQNNLEKEQLRELTFLNFNTYCRLQQPKQCGTGMRTNMKVNGTEKSRNKSIHLLS